MVEDDRKKAYKKLELKTVELKRRVSLLESSLTGEVGYNQTFEDKSLPKA